MSEQSAITRRDEDMLQLRKQLEQQAPEFAKILPAHIGTDRFTRVLQTAIQRGPELLHAGRKSLFEACMKCAEDGLLPDGREAVLLVVNEKVKDRFNKPVKDESGREQWVAKVQYRPMVYGIRKKVLQSGEIKGLTARVAYENDDFDYAYGTEEWIRHKPTLSGRGKIIAAYAVATYRDNTTEFDVLPVEEIEKVRRVSRNSDTGPWKDWYEEMAKKTAIRRLSKALPLSSENRRVIERDDHFVTLSPSQYRGDVQEPARPATAALPAGGNGTPRTLDDFAAQQTEQVAQPESASEEAPEATPPAQDDPPHPEAGASDDPDYKAGFSAGLEGKTKRSMPADIRDDEARADAWRRGLEAGLKARGQQATESEEAEV